MASGYETVDRIRRSHRAARPNPAENPAWANCHMDCGILLEEIEALREKIVKGIEAESLGARHPDFDGGWDSALARAIEIVRDAFSVEATDNG